MSNDIKTSSSVINSLTTDLHSVDTPLKLGRRVTFDSVIDILKRAKELLLLAAFFGGAVVWVANYFATSKQFEELECYTKINVRMLGATSNATFTEQLARQGRSDLRLQNSQLSKLRSRIGANNAEVENEIQAKLERIDDITNTNKTYEKTIDSENKAAKKGFTALTQYSCLIKEQRKELLKQIASGEF